MKREVFIEYQQLANKTKLCLWLHIARSSCYYRPSGGKRGVRPSTYTVTKDGRIVSNDQVVKDLISQVFSQEFNLYGYQLSTEELRAMGYIINPKKTYRLMKEKGLLLKKISNKTVPKKRVIWRKIRGVSPLECLCMDITYVYIHGARRNAYLLAIIDVATRYVVGWSLLFSMKHTDVILCLHAVLQGFKAKLILLRTDNGSQFIAHGLRDFCIKNGITHEFTHVATPQENAYVESLFSLVEREVIQRYEFESIYHDRDVFTRYFNWHNNKRRRHALGKMSPADFWHTVFSCHPVKPPKAQSGEFVKGDDTFENLTFESSLALPLTNSERGLSLLNKDDNENVLNHFENNVQNIGG